MFPSLQNFIKGLSLCGKRTTNSYLSHQMAVLSKLPTYGCSYIQFSSCVNIDHISRRKVLHQIKTSRTQQARSHHTACVTRNLSSHPAYNFNRHCGPHAQVQPFILRSLLSSSSSNIQTGRIASSRERTHAIAGVPSSTENIGSVDNNPEAACGCDVSVDAGYAGEDGAAEGEAGYGADGPTLQASHLLSGHIPVLVQEVLEALQPKDSQIIVDMTFGGGGHTREILKAAPGVRLYASDRDPLAHSNALKLAAEVGEGCVTPILSRFSEIPHHFQEHGVLPGSVDAFLFDLGASSMQFDTPTRGFSLSRDGPLDMRMDGDRYPDNPTAADVVNSLDPQDLMHILKKYGEEKKAREIAHAIVEARYAFGNFTRTRQLADVIGNVFESDVFRRDKMFRQAHLATKTFQALRIFVNDELNELHNGLKIARHFLKPGGRCVVISFHSLEDRIVKRHFHDIDIDEKANATIHDHFRNAEVSFDVRELEDEFLTKPWRPISRKVVEASDEECFRNPRARSAKLRAAIKMDL